MLRNVLLIFLLLIQYVYASIDYTQLKKDRDACYSIQTSNCFLKLNNKYSLATNEWKNILYFDYAQALLWEKNYAKAKEAFKTVLFREKNNKQIINASQKKIDEINELYKKMSAAENIDTGNYVDKKKEKIVWQNPSNIKIYIASGVGKEDIFKRAFAIWDDKLYKQINFSYVNNSADADITIKYVNSLSESRVGITKYPQILNVGNKKYLKKVNIEISLNNLNGGKFTDTNLLSITLHEIGHALGVSYHSDNLNDIMYYSTDSYKNTSVSRRDVNTVEYLYR